MKASKSILASLVLVLFLSVAAVAHPRAKVIAVINRASWCPVCQKNGKRAMSVLMGHNKNGAVQFVFNNLSNKKTIQKSNMRLRKLALYKKMSKFKNTGVVYFFNAKSKHLISHISLAKSNQELADAMSGAMTKAMSNTMSGAKKAAW